MSADVIAVKRLCVEEGHKTMGTLTVNSFLFLKLVMLDSQLRSFIKREKQFASFSFLVVGFQLMAHLEIFFS